jgi:hypothetical protein
MAGGFVLWRGDVVGWRVHDVVFIVCYRHRVSGLIAQVSGPAFVVLPGLPDAFPV